MVIGKRSFIGGFILITVAIVALGFFINNFPKQQAEQGQWVAHTHAVMSKLELLQGQIAAVKAVQLSYQQTHSVLDYQNYRQASDTLQKNLSEIETLTKDNANQQARLPELKLVIGTLLNRFEQSMNPSLAVPSASLDQAEVQAIAQRIEAMHQEEEQLLAARLARWQKLVTRNRTTIILSVAALYAFMLLAYGIARHDYSMREHMLSIESETAKMHQSMAARMTQIVKIQQEIIMQRLNLEKAMETITSRSENITRADGAVIEILSGDDMEYKAASGNMKSFIGFKIKAEGSLSGRCVAMGSAMRCDDTEEDERVDKEACRKVGVRSMIVVPLIIENQTVGVLKVAAAKTHAFHAEDISTLQLMAGVLSATLRDAQEADRLQDNNMTLTMNNALLKTQKSQLEADRDTLQTRADSDGLTGLKNYRYFQESLSQEFDRAVRYNTLLSLVLIDVDHFKQFNDQFGHPAGDAVLKQVGQILKKNARPSDIVARYGGEEFVMILTQTGLDGGVTTAERLRKAIEEAHWTHRNITVSVGISGIENRPADAAGMVQQADSALYESKKFGRNRVTCFEVDGMPA